jgi:hypothetical protein
MNDIKEIVEIVRVRLFDKFYSNNLKPSKSQIKSWIDKTIIFLEKEINAEQEDKIIRDLLKESKNKVSGYEAITNEKSKPWLHTREECDQYSRLYKLYLLEQGKIPPVSINEIFDDEQIEVVCIASNDDDHSNHIQKCLIKNKHTFVEKPAFLKISDAKKTFNILKNKKNIFFTLITYLENLKDL